MFHTISLYVATALFLLGLGFKVSTWFRHGLRTKDGASVSTSERFAAAVKGVLSTVLSPKIFTLVGTFFLDAVLQVRLLRRSFPRWLMHMCIYGGFMMLLLAHALDSFTMKVLFKDYQSTVNPFLLLREISGAVVFAGIAMAVLRRFALRTSRLRTNAMDVYAIAILAVIMVSGIFLEGVKITSYTRYKDMVEEYGNLSGDEEKALETYWVSDFGVVSPQVKGPFDPKALQEGKMLHEMSCAQCHAHPDSAFMGYAISQALGPVALSLDKANGVGFLTYLHYLACLIGLALLPFTKMFHIFSSPLSLMANAVMSKGTSDPANIATRQMIELDACTHCGACTLQCSVAVVFEEIGNKNILPSEKMASIRALASGRELDDAEAMVLQQGVHLCTNCTRCTVACPVGINLAELWLSVRDALLRRSVPELLLLSPLSAYRVAMNGSVNQELYKHLTERAKNAVSGACDPENTHSSAQPLVPFDNGLPEKLESFVNSMRQPQCYKCSTCTNVCPVVRNYTNPEETLGLLPHQLMHAVQLRLWNIALSSGMLWNCLGCYECQQSCPMAVEVTDILYELKNLAVSCTLEKISK